MNPRQDDCAKSSCQCALYITTIMLVNKELLTGTKEVNTKLLSGTVLVNKKLLLGFDPIYGQFSFFCSLFLLYCM